MIGPKSKTRYRWVLGLLAIGVLVLVAENRAEPRQIEQVVRNARPAWLALAAVLQAATYPCTALVWAVAIRRSGARAPSFPQLVRLSVAELFTDQSVPSGGMSGTVLVVAALQKRGVSDRGAMAAVLSSLVGFYVAQLGSVIAAIVILLTSGSFGGWEATVSLLALAAAVTMPVPVVATLAGAMKKLPERVQRIRAVADVREHVRDAPKDVIFSGPVLGPAVLLRATIVVLDGSTLALCLVAVGSPLLLLHAWAAYVLAYVVGTASFLPGGLGPFEVTSTTLLADLGAPLFAAAPATLLMRALSFWLPMVPGGWFTQHEVSTPPKRPAPTHD